MIGGHPALRWLAAAKFRGALRKQWRRAKTPSGIVLALLGLALLATWFASLLVPALVQHGPRAETPIEVFQVGLALFAVLSVSSALSYRGLYVPQAEIERLFSAPVSRGELVRYRLLAMLGRSLLGSFVLGFLAMRHAPNPLYGFFGAWLASLTLPLLSQAVSLLAGDAENRLTARIAKFPRGAFNLILTVLIAIGVAAAFLRGNKVGGIIREHLEHLGGGDPMSWLQLPLVRALLAPTLPWARAIAATDLLSFASWFGACVAIWLVGFELVARIPVDYRELSLETASDVAKRLRRAHRGTGGAGAARAPVTSAGWQVPWLFGEGPFGALAWRKLAGMVRKSRTALLTGVIVVAVVVAMSVLMLRGGHGTAEAGTAIIVFAGTLYLCSALRFDFREDVDALVVIKSWPIAPWRVFAATLAPQTAVVSLLIAAGLVARGLITGQWPWLLAPSLLAVPLIAGAWLAIDNAAFLFAPMRATPGQDGVLQNTGRAMLLMMLKFGAFLVFALVGGVPIGLLWLLHRWLEFDEHVLFVASSALALLALFAALATLVWVGGLFLRRFDVARDRA